MNNAHHFVVHASLLLAVACNTSNAATPPPQLQPTIEPTAAPLPSATSIAPAPPGEQRYQGADARAATDEELAEVLTHTSGFLQDVTYCTIDGVELKMDVYLPEGTTGKLPLAVFIHGGGWSTGDKRAAAAASDFPALLDAGFAVASLAYRLAPEYKSPAMIVDVKCAFRSLRANAETYGVDPERIGVWGMSAGANLSMMVAVTDTSAGFDVGQYLDQSSRVKAVVDMSGPVDLTVDFSPTFVGLKEQVFAGIDLAKASPITYITPDDPPFLIMQGERDRIVPASSGQAKALRDKLAATGVPVEVVLVQGGSHTLDAAGQQPRREELTQMIVKFFMQYVK
jgi:acetyl esterase/lipase